VRAKAQVHLRERRDKVAYAACYAELVNRAGLTDDPEVRCTP